MAWSKEYALDYTNFGEWWAKSTDFTDEAIANFDWNAEESRLWNMPTEAWNKNVLGFEGSVVIWTNTTPIWSDTTLWTTTLWTKES